MPAGRFQNWLCNSPRDLLDNGAHKLGALARLALSLRRTGLGSAGGGFLLSCQRSGAEGQRGSFHLDMMTLFFTWGKRGKDGDK